MLKMKTNILSALLLFLVVLSIDTSQAQDYCTDVTGNLQKIDTLNLLLPLIFDESPSRSIHYTLKGYHGSYEWESSEPSILKVDAVKNNARACYSEAIVSLATNKPYNNVIWIKAENKETKDVVKCESKIAKIKRIEILTKFRRINVGDLEVLELLGYDEEGNVFSTLEGLRFEWTIADSNLEIVPLKDTSYVSSETRRKIETQNYQSDILVVRGLRTGKTPVSVKLKERDYGDVADSVTISVIEIFEVAPKSPLYVLPYSVVQFRIFTIASELNKRQSQAVSLPSPNYGWTNKNVNLGDLGQNGVLECGKNKGVVDFIVQDNQSLDNKYNGKVHIVDPYGLNIYIKEFDAADWDEKPFDLFAKSSVDLEKFDNVWSLIKGHVYHIRAQIFDEERNIIHIGNNINIHFDLNSKYIEVLERRNFEIKVRAKELVEKHTVKASINEIVNIKGKYTPSLTESKDFSVVSQISIIKPDSFIHLPLSKHNDKNPNSQQIFQLTAIGGSKNYEFVSENMNIAVIGNSGIILPKDIGRTTIFVKDRANYKNLDKIELEVSYVSNLDFLENYKELNVDSIGYMNVLATGGRLSSRYSNCTFLSIIPHLVENRDIATHIPEKIGYSEYLAYLLGLYNTNLHYKKLLSDYESSYLSYNNYESYVRDNIIKSEELTNILNYYRNFGMCSQIILKGTYKGESQVQAHLSTHSGDSVLSLENSRLRVYEKIFIVNPNITVKNLINEGEREVLLTYGSSFDLDLEGGPYKWDRRQLNKRPVYESKKPTSERLLDVQQLSTSSQKSALRVLCNYPKTKGQSEYAYSLDLTVWNEPDEQLPEPVKQSYKISITCSVPSILKIYIQNNKRFLNINDVQNALSESFTLRNQHSHIFQAWVYDSNKKPFYNFSSLNIDWRLTPDNAGRLYRTKSPEHDKLPVVYRDEFQTLDLDTVEREVKLRATSMSYEYYGEDALTFEKIYDEVIISIKGDIDIDPPFKILYLDRENHYDAEILKGSGDFSVDVINNTVIKHIYNRETKKITVYPLTLGQTEIRVEDTKLISSKPVTAKVIVTTVGRIELSLKSNLIQEGSTTIATIDAYDLEGNKFDEDQLRFMNLELNIHNHYDYEKTHIEVIRVPRTHNQYEIIGKRNGDYRLFGRAEILAKRSGSDYLEKKIIYSSQVGLSVFSKLEVIPKTLLLAPGCSASVELRGGPSNSSQGHFRFNSKVESSTIIQVSSPEVEHFSVFSVVKGSVEGQTSIVFEIHHTRGEFITSVTLPVEVAYPDRVEIQGLQDRKIHEKTQFRLIAFTSLNNRMFHPAVCPYEYTWKTKSENIIQLDQGPEISIPLHDLGLKGEKVLNNYHFAINATALRPGLADIELFVEAHYYNPTYFKRAYTNSFRIQVIERMTSPMPSYISEDSLIPSVLLIPPFISYQIKSFPEKQNVKYSLLCSGSSYGLALSSSGLLTAQGDNGRATVVVEDSSSFSQFFMVNAAITNIFSIFIEDSYQAANMNLRAEKNLNIYLQDSFGRLFPAPGDLQGLVLSVYVSNNTVIDAFIENSVLNLKTKSQGISICRVYLSENPMIFDQFIVVVGSALLEGSSVVVHLDGIVQFKVAASGGHKRRWSSDNSDIIEIDAHSGRGIAKQEGRTDIIYSGTSTSLIKARVIRVDNIDKATDIDVLTNIPSNPGFRHEYKIDFRVFSGDYELKSFNNEGETANNNLQFRCESDHPEWIEVNGEIDGKIPRCVVQLKNHYPSGPFPERISITTTIYSKASYSRFRYSETFEFKVLWAFKSTEPIVKIFLHKNSNTKTFAFRTQEKLEINTDIKNYIETSFDKDKQLMRVKIDVSPQSGAFDTNILVENPRTRQTEKVPVTYTRSELSTSDIKPSSSNSSFSFGDASLIGGVFVLFFAFIYVNRT